MRKERWLRRWAGYAIPVLALLVGSEMYGEGLGGVWSGNLQITPQVKLKMVFNISEPGHEPPVITMDSPDQGAYGIPAEVNYLSADSVSLSVSSIRMTFAGSLKDGVLSGTFTQGPLTLPLSLEPGQTEAKRPQTPLPPFPYETEDVSIANNESPGVTLSGTLTVPPGANSGTPLVVMVTGSGLQNRDEEVFGHKPFAVIADYLARNGIASYRYDDRGFGASSGDSSEATTADNASDAGAALKYFRETGRFGKTGILGHSEGALVGFMLGSAGSGAPDFIVALGGPAVRGDSILLFQNRRALVKAGMPESLADEYAEALGKALSYRISHPGVIFSETDMEGFCPGWKSRPVYKELAEGIMNSFGKPKAWIDFFMAYSPSRDIAAVKAPMLMLYGEKDTQVPPELNVPEARRLMSGGEVKVYPGLNHLMQHAQSGDISEYGSIEETISPDVLSDIAGFINGLK